MGLLSANPIEVFTATTTTATTGSVKRPAERRRHRVFRTRFTEYHLRDDECVGVRDRETGEWLRDHAALRLRAVSVPERGHDRVWIGRRLQFWGRAADVLTSPVTEVDRPVRKSVRRYVSRAASGEIV